MNDGPMFWIAPALELAGSKFDELYKLIAIVVFLVIPMVRGLIRAFSSRDTKVVTPAQPRRIAIFEKPAGSAPPISVPKERTPVHPTQPPSPEDSLRKRLVERLAQVRAPQQLRPKTEGGGPERQRLVDRMRKEASLAASGTRPQDDSPGSSSHEPLKGVVTEESRAQKLLTSVGLRQVILAQEILRRPPF